MKKIIYFSLFSTASFTLSIVEGTAQQNILPQNLFVLSSQEQTLFYAPYMSTYVWGNNYEDYPLRKLWEAFDAGLPPVPLTGTGPAGWYDLNGSGSQNHALLWVGEAALGNALSGNVSQYEIFAQKAIILLDSLDLVQGHMRHEAIGGYVAFWEGGIACMALAGLYAPAGSTSGPALLKSARRWWADHIALLRRLRMPDGQIARVGARSNHSDPGDDCIDNLKAAINLQIIDPQPHNTLFPDLMTLITADGQPLHGNGGTYALHWWDPRHVSERWIVLRAFQSGAILRVPANHSTPMMINDVYRWTSGTKSYVASPSVVGLQRCRYKVSWTAGNFVLVENADSSGSGGGKGLPNGHTPQTPFTIPATAQHVLGPVFTTANPTCVANGNCTNDAAAMSIVKPYHNGCMTTINPQVVIKNEGTNGITELALYYQIDNYTLYSEYSKGAIKSKRFTAPAPGLLPDSTITLTLDISTVTPGTHTLKVWTMDVNKVTDMNASNDLQSIQFDVVNSGIPALSYTEDFESTNAGDIPFDWTLYDADANGKWFVYSNGSNKAIAFNNFAYTGAQNKRDEVVMPVVDLTGSSSLYLSFDLYHASKPNSSVFDSLEVSISTDCGQTFLHVWGRGGTALNTVADNPNLFIPSGMADYQNVQIDLSAYTSYNNAILRFTNWSNNNNSTLIDNVNLLSTPPIAVEENNTDESIEAFPIPTNGVLNVRARFKYSQNDVSIRVMDMLGRTVKEINYPPDSSGYYSFLLDLSDLKPGIYEIIISNDNISFNKKISVIK